ncbi:MAG TPA: arylesterase, partial [Longimicrobiales bacterium]|nr:arylesterase [Longimicrobiales bacterium]
RPVREGDRHPTYETMPIQPSANASTRRLAGRRGATAPGRLLPLTLLFATLACTGDAPRPAPASAEGTGTRPAQTSPERDAGDAGEAADARGTVLFLGNSLTAGFGVAQDSSFPALIQAKIDSAGLPWRVVNGGLSGETSAGGLRRIEWYLEQPLDVLVLELGANDMLRGQDLGATKANLQGIIDAVRAAHPDVEVVIAGMLAPPNLGRAYVERFEGMYRELAEENDAALIPFLLEGVARERALNLADGMHPNARGHRIVADNVWAVLEGVLRRESPARPGV